MARDRLAWIVQKWQDEVTGVFSNEAAAREFITLVSQAPTRSEPMTTGFSRAFSNILLGNLLGERIVSYPHEVRCTIQLHHSNPGPDLDRNVIPRSERGALLIAESPTSGRIVIEPPATWARLDVPEGRLTTVFFSVVLDGQPLFGDMLSADGHRGPAVKVMRNDTLHLPDPITWTVGTL
jgi:hypothetical protein